jgi:RNA polymerase sigma-70 factor (ECF subfamily)
LFITFKRNNTPAIAKTEESDEELVKLYRRTKDMGIVGKLFERYTHLVYGVCLKYLKDDERCKDAVMEIFEALFAKLSTHSIHNFKNWLYSVARNYCLMEIRRENASCRLKSKLLNDFVQEDMDFEPMKHLFEKDDNIVTDQVLMQAIEALGSAQAICIKKMYMEEKTYKEITVETGFSMNEVKSHIQNGKRNLKNYLIKLNASNK